MNINTNLNLIIAHAKLLLANDCDKNEKIEILYDMKNTIDEIIQHIRGDR